MKFYRATANHTNPNRRIITMRTTILTALTVLALLGSASLLSACHTTAGAGEDISSTGHAITHSADKNTP